MMQITVTADNLTECEDAYRALIENTEMIVQRTRRRYPVVAEFAKCRFVFLCRADLECVINQLKEAIDEKTCNGATALDRL